MFSIPLADSSIDVVYTSHLLEPNGGRESEAIEELMRVARKAVVLIEPAYELANTEARERMRSRGYVSGLKEAAIGLGLEVMDHSLLPICANPLNPSGLLVLREKTSTLLTGKTMSPWQCPITKTPLVQSSEGYYSPDSGLAYPVMKNIPLLKAEHAVIASAFNDIDE